MFNQGNILSRFLSIEMRQCKYAIVNTRPLCCHSRDPERAGSSTKLCRISSFGTCSPEVRKDVKRDRVIKAIKKCDNRLNNMYSIYI